ncbi:unnamed protein product, partial [Amoebophrya sp. A120]|eukprot:GSA120T00007731001.1
MVLVLPFLRFLGLALARLLLVPLFVVRVFLVLLAFFVSALALVVPTASAAARETGIIGVSDHRLQR